MTGWLEVYTYFEGKEFVLERLSTGSILNFKNLLMEGVSNVFVRSITNVKLYVIDIKILEEKLKKNPEIEKKFNVLSYQLMTQPNNFPLDYHLDCRRYKSLLAPKHYNSAAVKRRIMLKNIVFNKIIDIRKERQRPSLMKMLNIFKEGNEYQRKAFEARIKH